MRTTEKGWILLSESKGYSTSTIKSLFQKKQWDREMFLSMPNFSTDITGEDLQTASQFKDDKYIFKYQ